MNMESKRVAGPIKFGMLMAGFIAAWYFGQLIADAIIDGSVSRGLTVIQKIGQKSQSGVPFPKQHKCGHWTACPSGSFSFLVLSGSKKEKPPKICFEGEILLGREKDNYGRGMNIAVVEAKTGKHISSGTFDLWGGDNSGPMIEFLKKAPDGSLIFMATFDDSSVRLTEDAKKYIEGLGSKEIQKLAFRGNWVFVATKGFTLPKDYEREKVINSVKGNGAWASEIQILGCFSPKRDYL
ncbi:protein FAM3B-like isoform X2 [Pristis pectinata]|uniref:protein FAM3B-like isoform X2 n=1 Tax=Pristis pectinata TaxID=685728 RepID=UPI00223CE530|nr:protein FAM3B-like isoform X2 [Pristis pectinata]